MNLRWLYVSVFLQFVVMLVLGLQSPSNLLFVTMICLSFSILLLTFGLDQLERRCDQDESQHNKSL